MTKINPGWFEGVKTVGITAGASAPEHLVEEVIQYFRKLGVTTVKEEESVQESVKFGLPPELTKVAI